MRKIKKMLALVIAAVMIVGTMGMTVMADSTAGDVAYDSQITINGLDEGDVVHLYQVLTWVDGEGWKLNTPFADLADSTKDNYSVNVAKLVAGSDSQYVELSKDDVEKIATLAKTNSATDLGDGSEIGSDGVYTYGVDATADTGMYVALVTPGTAGVIYNPIVVSSDFNNTPNTSEINASTAKMGTSATAKKETITVTKTSEEKDQATNATTNDSTDSTNNAHDVGDIVMFTVTTKIPAYSNHYVDPSFSVTDTLSNGLEMVVDGDHPFTVTSNVAQDASNVAPKTKDTTWTVAFDSDAIAGITDYEDVTITYYAKITGDAVTNVTEEENTVKVEFSNNPNDSTDKGTLKDKTKHYTFTIDGNLLGGRGYRNSELVKVGVDKDGNPIESEITESSGYVAAALKGATFGLYYDKTDADAANNNYYKNDKFQGTVVTDELGLMKIEGLDAGTYYLKELDAPNGYIKDTKTYQIDIVANIVNETVHETDDDGRDISYDVPVLKSYTITITPGGSSTFSTTITGSDVLTSTTQGDTPTSIANTKGVELPSTGGMGTTIFYIIGAVLVLGAGILLVTRRRMSAN